MSTDRKQHNTEFSAALKQELARRKEEAMARHKTPETEIRRALAEGMKAGFAMGYDEAVVLAERIGEAWGGKMGNGLASELKKIRETILRTRSADIDRTSQP